jgi:hypothetical protein
MPRISGTCDRSRNLSGALIGGRCGAVGSPSKKKSPRADIQHAGIFSLPTTFETASQTYPDRLAVFQEAITVPQMSVI